MNECPLCQIIANKESYQGEIFYLGWDGAVVEDLDPGDAALRLLFIPPRHSATPTEADHQDARCLVWGIACALEVKRGYQIGGYEIITSGHWHTKLKLHKLQKGKL
jgi:hypothetical protein